MTPEELAEQNIKDRAREIAKYAVMLVAAGDCAAARDVIEDNASDPQVFGEVIHCLVHGVATTSQDLVAAEVVIKALRGDEVGPPPPYVRLDLGENE